MRPLPLDKWRTAIGVIKAPLEPFEDLYPFKSNFFDLAGLKYHYLDEGAGDPILMIHGNPSWSFHFRHLIIGLREQYRVIVPDHIGCGYSGKPQHYSYRLVQHIDNLEAFIESLGLKNITLVLHDWGVGIGMGWAIRHPELVKRLVILNGAAFHIPRIHWLLRFFNLPVIGPLTIRRFNAFARMATFIACQKHERMTPQVKAGYLAPYNSYANRIATLRFVQDIPLTPRHPTYSQVNALEKGLVKFKDIPIQIIWGGRDFVFTRDSLDIWKKHFPDAAVKELPEAGHYVADDGWEETLFSIKDFLRSHPV